MQPKIAKDRDRRSHIYESVDFRRIRVLFTRNKMKAATPMPQGSDRLRRRLTGAG